MGRINNLLISRASELNHWLPGNAVSHPPFANVFCAVPMLFSLALSLTRAGIEENDEPIISLYGASCYSCCGDTVSNTTTH